MRDRCSGHPGGGGASKKAKYRGLQRTHLQPTQLLLAQLADQRAQGNYPRLLDLGGQLLPIQLVLGTRKGVLGSRKKKKRNGEKEREEEYVLPLTSKRLPKKLRKN